MKQVIFTLCSGRSGTLFLRDIFRRNVRHLIGRHEPFFDYGNPTMLGPAIYAAWAGRWDRIRALLVRKRDYINRLTGQVYVECNHAFLKSMYVVALELFPQLQLVHLIRDPLKVAKSEAYREAWRRRVRAPFHYYRGQDGSRHFFWALTGREGIYRTFDVSHLSLFQRYLLQWIEIENRAVTFLNQHQLQPRCFTIHVPKDLNDRERLRSMFEFFGLSTARPQVVLGRRRNKSLGKTTVITSEDEQQAAEVLERLPARYLQIFRHEPYVRQEWCRRLFSLAERGSGNGLAEPSLGAACACSAQ
jgi:hypothetical protein